MAKTFSALLKITLVLSLVSLFSGSAVPVLAIIAQLLAVITIDCFFADDNSQTIIAENIKKYMAAEKYKEKASFISLCLFIISFGLVMIFVIPSFSSDDVIRIPDIRGIKPFSSEANYMSLEGFVATYCRMHGHEITRAEARKLVKAALAGNFDTAVIVKDEAVTCEEKAMAEKNTGHSAVLIAKNEEPMTIKKYNAALSDYRKHSMRTISSAPGRIHEGRARVAVLPFNNHTDNDYAVERVMKSIMADFREKGYEVISAGQIMRAVENGRYASESELARMAEILEADVVVAGDILKYNRHKKFRLAGFLVGNVFSGWHNYGDVELDTRIFRTSEGTCVYSNSVRKHEKQQLIGLFTSSGRAMGRSVDEAVDTLYKDYNRNDYALFHERRKNSCHQDACSSGLSCPDNGCAPAPACKKNKCVSLCSCAEALSCGNFNETFNGSSEEPVVEIYNPTKFVMMVKLTSKTDGRVRTMNVQPHASNDMSLPAGAYNYYMFTVDDPAVNSSNQTVVFNFGHSYKLSILKDRCDTECRVHNKVIALNY